MKGKRITAALCAICMTMLTACGGASHENATTSPAGVVETAAAEGDASGEAPAYEAAPSGDAEYAPREEAAGDKAETHAETYATTVAAATAMDDSPEADGAWEIESYDEVAGVDDMPPEETMAEAGSSQIQAGQLTAGEWNDNENWGFFINLCNNGLIQYPAYGIDPRFRTAVTVKDTSGAPVVNARVTLFDEQDPSWTAVTDKQGIVYLFGKGDNLQITSGDVTRFYRISPAQEPAVTEPVVTTAPVEQQPVETERTTVHDAAVIVLRRSAAELLGQDAADLLFGKAEETPVEETPAMAQVAEEFRQSESGFVSNEVEITFDGSGEKYDEMQIMFIVDTTGSMGDELAFLQSEFTAIAQTVGTENVSYSVNFYKDEGDPYVTKTNGFSGDINEISKKLNSEVASGGGDTPEAVSEILDECMHSQEWREDTVKLAFLIFDAPPHSGKQSFDTLESAMKAASAQGIRVIPVVSSNTERETELFGRGLAIFTGGTYVFLTNDSGIGDSHLEPVIGHYEVESLYSLIIRLIEEYRQ
ncbi:MAG: VWA domain-containing protein [Oscillospiraceae bacterium]|nr:VWA domain-containing protein [Oscillospiraceae bacterium]